MRKIISFLSAVFLLFMIISCTKSKEAEVVVYTSLDQIFSEPILQEYEKRTGVKVKAVYDVEASKTTGLVNRLIAEKDRPKRSEEHTSELQSH